MRITLHKVPMDIMEDHHFYIWSCLGYLFGHEQGGHCHCTPHSPCDNDWQELPDTLTWCGQTIFIIVEERRTHGWSCGVISTFQRCASVGTRHHNQNQLHQRKQWEKTNLARPSMTSANRRRWGGIKGCNPPPSHQQDVLEAKEKPKQQQQPRSTVKSLAKQQPKEEQQQQQQKHHQEL